jgi:hypothetical protein
LVHVEFPIWLAKVGWVIFKSSFVFRTHPNNAAATIITNIFTFPVSLGYFDSHHPTIKAA